MTTFLEHLPTDHIETRLATLKAKLVELEARIAAGERSDYITEKMVRGVWVTVTALEHSRNNHRYNISQCERELAARAA